jgi:signal transduction histidine kinase
MQTPNNTGWFVVIGSATMLVLLLFFLLLFFQYVRRRLRHQEEVYSLRKSFDQELLRSQLEIQEQTFLYISREIHDNIGQILSLVRLNINTLGPVHDEPKRLLTDELLEQAISELRSLSHSLNSDHIQELGLVKTLCKSLSAIEKTGVVKTELTTESDYYSVDKEHLIILFRIVQELLSNIVRHADATKLELQLLGKNELESLILSDDGVGFDAGSEQLNGIGLANIRVRAKMIGAEIIFQSPASGGTQVRIDLGTK